MIMGENVLNGSRVYLAGNMEYTAGALGWREYVKNKLTPSGIKILSPVDTKFVGHPTESPQDIARMKVERQNGNYDLVHSHMKRVVRKDLRLIDLSDFIIINMEVSKPTFGTMHELVVAVQQKKPIFLAISEGRSSCPLWILGLLKPEYIYDSIEDVVETVIKIDKGNIKMNPDRWRLLESSNL
jgi:nucleoside 2-deoxyribosyltransferase